VPYIGLENIESWSGRLLPIDPDVVPTGTANAFKAGHTLFGKLRPYLAKACNPNFDGLCSTELLVLEGADIDRRALLYTLLAYGFVKLVDSSTYGSKMPRASWDFVGNCAVPIPPADEQLAIADFLDRETAKIDTLVAKKRTLIERLKEKRTALISRTVTRGLPPDAARAADLDPHPKLKPSGIDWLGDVPEHWITWKATHGFRKIGSGTTPKSDDADYYDGDIPWVTTSELREAVIMDTAAKVTESALLDYTALRLYAKGTLLFAMYGATIGRLGILGIPATVNQACTAFSEPLKLDTWFTYYWLQMRRPTLIILSVGGGQPNLSQDDLRQLRIPAPPLEEQRAIAAFLDHETAKIEGMVAKAETAIERLQEYRTALITAAVTGKVDARRAVA
jgi:type I restriction enzyme S subunit